MSFSAKSADDLLHAYFAERGATPPSIEARELLTSYVLGGFRWRDNRQRALCHETLARANFDVEDFAENFLEIDLYVENLSEFDKRADAAVFGLAKPAGRTIKICERALVYEPLYRATVLHEVAHILKHDGSHMRTLCYAPGSKRRPKEEREA